MAAGNWYMGMRRIRDARLAPRGRRRSSHHGSARCRRKQLGRAGLALEGASMRDPGAWPEPREQPGYNGASSTRPTDPASPPRAGGLGLSPDADREAALPENPPGSAEKHAHRA